MQVVGVAAAPWGPELVEFPPSTVVVVVALPAPFACSLRRLSVSACRPASLGDVTTAARVSMGLAHPRMLPLSLELPLADTQPASHPGHLRYRCRRCRSRLGRPSLGLSDDC